MNDDRRITLVSRGANSPVRMWDDSAVAANHIIFVDSFAMLLFALDYSQDVDRLLIDGTATPVEFLDLMAALPHTFPGDVLLMRTGNDNSFLSTVARAEGRLLYALNPNDLQFYLETHGLVMSVALAA